MGASITSVNSALSKAVQSVSNTLDYKYVDVESDSIDYSIIQSVDTDQEFQFLRQAWEPTSSVDSFWFLNSSGDILRLGRHSFSVGAKTGEVDDWNADKYKYTEVCKRSKILTAGVAAYGCTSVNAESVSSSSSIQAYFWTVSQKDYSTVLIKFYSFTSGGYLLAASCEVGLVVRELGTRLNNGTDALYTYKDMSVSDFIGSAVYTSTSIGGYVIFGIHVDNNFNQWALLINVAAGGSVKASVMQGYGFVGFDGTLTGGEIPRQFFSVASGGFNDIVQPLTYLETSGLFGGKKDKDTHEISSIDELYAVPSVVAGDDKQQWYIASSVQDIVSHIKYSQSSHSFTPVYLPLNNNYSIKYKSPSFYSQTLTDRGLLSVTLEKLLLSDIDSAANSTVRSILKAVLIFGGYPNVYFMMPRVSTIGYLQQSLGQYAYVHYGSTSISRKSSGSLGAFSGSGQEQNTYDEDNLESTENKSSITPLLEDDFSFNTQVVKQKIKGSSDSVFKDAFVTFAMLGVSAVNFAVSQLSVNSTQNQAAVNTYGRQYSQMFLKNIEAFSASNMVVSGITPSFTSAVTGVMTLDMFYSTSDKQHCYAGPGYVNHNFVAQCVAQSSTSDQLELSQLTVSLFIKELTLWRVRMLRTAGQIGYDIIKQQAEAAGNTFNGTGAMTAIAIIHFGIVSQLAYIVLLSAMKATLAGYDMFIDVVGGILDTIGGSGAQSNITAQKSVHKYDIEGKHRYGSKHESFYYPCYGNDISTPYADEKVEAVFENSPWALHQTKFFNSVSGVSRYFAGGSDSKNYNAQAIDFADSTQDNKSITDDWNTDSVPYYTVLCRSGRYKGNMPANMSYAIGAASFLPSTAFKNENIDCGEPVFTAPNVQDYIIDENWQLTQTAAGTNGVAWVSCKDTKLFDGPASNIIVTPSFCGVASTYTAVEIRHGIRQEYIRPWAVTPEVLALNCSGKNAIYKKKLYHAFDGVGGRLVSWKGSSGIDKESLNYHYCFQVNDDFKRSNKLSPGHFIGNYNAPPYVSVQTDIEDRLYNSIMVPSRGDFGAMLIGEDKDIVRYSIPVFTEFLSTLPAAVKTLAPYRLSVVDGVTSLVTDLRNTQVAYKAPESIDFTIGTDTYRMTPEYICSVRTHDGAVVVEPLVPVLGLTYLGSTPYDAYLYSQATRQYYMYSGGTSLRLVDMAERFRDLKTGRYDFINQAVVADCLATFDRLDSSVLDDSDETDNIMCIVLKEGSVAGELEPPNTNIFDTESWFRIVSLPSGLCYQGPNRVIINRSVYSGYMKSGIIGNRGHWAKVHKEKYHPFRTYAKKFSSIADGFIGSSIKVNGWTHNPFLLVTSALGVSSEIDCLFEWEITFAWPAEMDSLYPVNSYAVVNVLAETFTAGGKVVPERPVHIYLTKELFTRTGSYGYYSFRYQSKNGIGSRERLHIWSDSYIAVSSLQCEYKAITAKRSELLSQQADVSGMVEL